jgi:FkbH-like protein
VIGEGAVQHFLDRQQTLAELKGRGVLLSINSKNDPANVDFKGAALRYEDFVAPQINWEPKTKNMANIAAMLNLKTQDFIFIDDRPDELERMRETFPEMVLLNACEPATWKWMSDWKRHLTAGEGEDRTKLYHERAAREEFLAEERKPDADAEDERAALERLGISVKLETVPKAGLKRATELINRTNQFNVAGSRTTLEALQSGLGEDHWVVTATASDKFGDMGVVGVMRVDRNAEGLSVPIFVLSCRVFGMGIEYALLNSVRELAEPDADLVGHYRETQHNKPGRSLYEKSGLRWNGAEWEGRVGDLPPDPEWLKVERRVAAA